MNATIYTKDNCSFCIRAKTLFAVKGIKYEEKKIGSDVTVEDLKAIVPNARTVPQIWLDGSYIGGYTELAAFFNEK